MNRIIFLHHSTGNCIWLGDTNHYLSKLGVKGSVQKFFESWNKNTGTEYFISEQVFPKKSPYGWRNYPFDYYNIWVKNGGMERYMDEPTLEILAGGYDTIIFKHCFPVGRILEDTGKPDINSEEKRLENYKLQYQALKEKMHSFPDKKFILWTPPALVKSQVTPDQALRTKEFCRWIVEDWDEPGSNIFIWDFYSYETEGELYLREEYAISPLDSHPNRAFSEKMATVFAKFIIDVIEQNQYHPEDENKQYFQENTARNY